jgi:hypothetical protein
MWREQQLSQQLDIALVLVWLMLAAVCVQGQLLWAVSCLACWSWCLITGLCSCSGDIALRALHTQMLVLITLTLWSNSHCWIFKLAARRQIVDELCIERPAAT